MSIPHVRRRLQAQFDLRDATVALRELEADLASALTIRSHSRLAEINLRGQTLDDQARVEELWRAVNEARGERDGAEDALASATRAEEDALEAAQEAFLELPRWRKWLAVITGSVPK